MNKQELIKKYEDLFEKLYEFPIVAINRVIADLKKLDEPQKVQVPQFVADWIEYCKAREITLAHALYRSEESKNKSVYCWIIEDLDRQETFARAWLDGYTIEKEPKYTVKCKTTKQYLSNDELGPHFDPNFRSNFTKSDLEKLGLGWVFDCEGMEVEEVEE